VKGKYIPWGVISGQRERERESSCGWMPFLSPTSAKDHILYSTTNRLLREGSRDVTPIYVCYAFHKLLQALQGVYQTSARNAVTGLCARSWTHIHIWKAFEEQWIHCYSNVSFDHCQQSHSWLSYTLGQLNSE